MKKKSEPSMHELAIQNSLAPLVDVCHLWTDGQTPFETFFIHSAITFDHEVQRQKRDVIEKARAEFLAANPKKNNFHFEESFDSGYSLSLKVVMALPAWEKKALIQRVKAKLGL